MFNINFVDDWIRTADLWSWKKPLYQVSQWATITAQDTTKFNWTKRPFLTLPFRNVCLGSNAVEWFNQDAYCQFSANLMLYLTSERTILNWVSFEASEIFHCKKWAIPTSFSFIFRLLQFLQQINVKNVHPVHTILWWDRTHDFQNISLLPSRLDQGSRPESFIDTKFQL